MTDDTHSIKVSIGGFALSVSGSRDFVEEHFFELYDTHEVAEMEIPKSARDTGTGSNVERGNPSSEEESVEAQSLEDYMAESELSSMKDNALAVAWYLQDVEKQDDIIKTEVREYAEKTKVPVGKNLSRDLKSNVEEQYMHQPGGKREGETIFWVTDEGREYLQENEIPAVDLRGKL